MPVNLTGRRQGFEQILRRDFVSFMHRVFKTVSPSETMHLGWHLEAIAWELHCVEVGENRRLIINLPPRSLKSIATSVAWVAWLLGHDPSRRIICVSYSQVLANKLHSDCRRVMESEWYRRLFPNLEFKATATEIETSLNGGRLATSVDGVLTGRGADYIIIDDPMKADDANSQLARASVKNWFGGTLLSRLNNKISGSIVLTMQRLHEDDLSGYLLTSGDWRHVNFPAIAVEDQILTLGPPAREHRRRVGDLLQPDREPLETLRAIERSMGSVAFAAQYQQAPVPKDGNLVRRAWLRRYAQPPAPRKGARIGQSWDCASKTGPLNDYSACVTALIEGSDIYILDVFRAKLPFPELLRKVVELARRFSPTHLLIEEAASGLQLIQQLKADNPKGVPRPIARRPESDKISRFSGCTAAIEAGALLLPESALWLAEFERELLGFPSAAHDDQVDALAQLMIWERETPKLPRFHFPVDDVYEEHWTAAAR